MGNNEVIFPVEQPINWCSAIIVAVSICVDYTYLNTVVKRETSPMTLVESSLAKLSG